MSPNHLSISEGSDCAGDQANRNIHWMHIHNCQSFMKRLMHDGEQADWKGRHLKSVLSNRVLSFLHNNMSLLTLKLSRQQNPVQYHKYG